ncbi:MAG TPA: class I SAM-dependent methyltransferase [Edaphobacter sp.]|nr:class I SAM-dependent methyltransferase [Edaphobacter sp.]
MKSVTRFDGKVADYAQFRERYSPEVLLPRLREWCGLHPSWTIADIGAGTGMLSDIFLANHNRTFAVEPNAEMREMCRHLHSDSSLLHIADGTAENTGLEPSSVEMVSAGRAMHWFNLDRATAEFQRILKPGGWVAIIAFGRTQTGNEVNEGIEDLLRQFSKDHADTHAGYKVYRELHHYFPVDFRHEEILDSMQMDWNSLHGIVMSISHSPAKTDPVYPQFERDLYSLFSRFESNGTIELQTRYWINVGRFSRA